MSQENKPAPNPSDPSTLRISGDINTVGAEPSV